MILDQETYDRLNAIEVGIEALWKTTEAIWKTTDDIFEAFDKLYARVNTIEALTGTQPDAEPPEEATATVEANAGKDNDETKKPKAKKKTVRKIS